MSQLDGFNRRAFLRTTGMTALAGAVGSGTSFAGVARAATGAVAPGGVIAPGDGKFDFDTPYSRLGTDSTKWDAAVRTNIIRVGPGEFWGWAGGAVALAVNWKLDRATTAGIVAGADVPADSRIPLSADEFSLQPVLAEEVIQSDRQVDRREVVIEEECLKMLALHQPVAGDLRRIARAGGFRPPGRSRKRSGPAWNARNVKNAVNESGCPAPRITKPSSPGENFARRPPRS